MGQQPRPGAGTSHMLHSQEGPCIVCSVSVQSLLFNAITLVGGLHSVLTETVNALYMDLPMKLGSMPVGLQVTLSGRRLGGPSCAWKTSVHRSVAALQDESMSGQQSPYRAHGASQKQPAGARAPQYPEQLPMPKIFTLARSGCCAHLRICPMEGRAKLLHMIVIRSALRAIFSVILVPLHYWLNSACKVRACWMSTSLPTQRSPCSRVGCANRRDAIIPPQHGEGSMLSKLVWLASPWPNLEEQVPLTGVE